MASEETLGTGRTGGRDATTGVIPGRYALAVGMPDLPAPQGWAWTPLSSLAELESGHTPSRKHPEYWDGSIPWIGIKDAVQNHGRTIDDTIQHVTELGLANSSARLLPKDTVCLSRTASVGYVVVMGRPMATSQDFVNWVCGPRLIPQFLKYVLVAENEALWRFARGTTHQTIYYPEAKAFHVCLPPIKEQRAIANILCTLDDKIELNRRMNETLEAMARAIFKSWFVDFDPVRAKASGEPPESICRRLGLTPDLLALFPDRLVDSELGEIPEGWEVTAVGDVVKIVGGSTPSTKNPEFWENGTTYWATPKDLSGLGVPVLLDTERKITEVGLSQISSGLLPVGTLLMSSRAPIGYLAISEVPVAINQGFIAMVCEEPLSPYYMLGWCQWNMDAIKQRAGGTTFAEISKGSFRQISITLPSPDLLMSFSEMVEPIYRLITERSRENAVLSNIRDALLPKLVSGDIPVPVVEG